MTWFIRKHCIIILLLIGFPPLMLMVIAQSSIHYDQYTSENGLSENVVYCIYQDNRGFLWAGTDYGLNRFDGYSFTPYLSINSDTTSLSNSGITCISDDDKGKLWIGTFQGLNYFDPSSGKAERIYLPGRGLNYGVSDIYRLDDDHLILLSGNEKYLFNTNLRDFHKIYPGDSNMVITMKVFELPQNRIGIISGADLHHVLIGLFDREGKTVEYKTIAEVFPFAKEKTIDYYFHDKYGNHFLASHVKRSLNVYDSAGKLIASVDRTLLNKIMPLHVYCISAVRDEVWIGTSHGLIIYNHITQSFSYPELKGDSKSIPGNKEIRAILEDHSHNVWIGVFGEGLLKCDIKPSPFSHLTLAEISRNELARMIFGLYNWPDNIVAVETTYGNISLIKNNQLIDNIPYENLQQHQVIKMVTGKSFNELSLFHKSTFDTLYKKAHNLRPYNFVLPDDTTVIENSSGLTIHTPSSIKKYGSFANNIIYDQQYYWVSTFEGLLRIDRKTLLDTTFRYTPGNPFSISDSRLYYICADENDNLWIGTKGGGLNYYNKKENKFYHYTTSNGLPDNVVYFILPDHDGFFWLTTNKGISRLDPRDMTFINYSKRDGLINSEFNRLGGLMAPDGTIYLAGTNGIDYFKPKDIDTIRSVDFIHITNWKVNDRDTTLLPGARLRHVQNNIQVYFTTNDFVRPDLIYFRYRLQSDEPWIRTQGRNFASFSGLAHGKYNFEVQASYDNLHWSPSALQAFTIRTPWWKSWWFFTLCVAAIAVGLYSFYWFRIEQLKRLHAMRSKISRDLHDEVGSTLSSIHVYSSVAEKAITKNHAATLDALKHIHENSRQVMENMSDIVWAINTGQNGEISLEKKLKNYGFDLLTPLGINTSYVIDHEAEKRLLNIEARKNVLLIAKEAMNNVARYSKASQASVFLTLSDHYLQLRIEDNGMGFNSANGRKGNGIFNMQKRTEAMGGKFDLASTMGEGTTIDCKIPLTSISDSWYKDGS